jgi:hypothetical protein
MSTVNAIEQKIRQMDGGEFQKLCNAYLSKCGYGKPHAFGSIAGSNKVKQGTPDTYFELADGKMAFAEHTAQTSGLFKKLSSDIGKCLNEKKTGVPIKNIGEIILCYAGELSPKEFSDLQSKCKRKGVNLTRFGISALASGLSEYPVLLRDFLDLTIDTGQVIPLEDFPDVYGKSKFATTLETKFHHRKNEIEEFATAIESSNLVVVSGKAGIGKSRFALEGCRNFIGAHPEYKAFAIAGASPNLYDDLLVYFSGHGQFLIFVDDANRISRFSYLMEILRRQKEGQHIKVVVTVRDYALNNIKTDIGDYPYRLINLDPFPNEQIKELAKEEFGIYNNFYLERIENLSKGNPRIAVMISKVALENQNLESINDVSALYDNYFSSIREDLQILTEPNLLKTAGVIAFFRVVDRTNQVVMKGITDSFRISGDDFWNYALRLHKLEMVDMYENEVVRVSDQVLSTYLFYLAFFKEKVLDFSDILANYFPAYRSKMYDSLNPTLEAFNQQAIFDIIRPKVQRLWDGSEESNSEEMSFLLAEAFWHLFPERTLALVKKRLAQTPSTPANYSQLENLDDNRLNNVPVTTEVQLLGQFRYMSPDLRRIALQILVDYVNVRQSEILQVLHVLTDDYGFDRFSNQSGVSIQQEIIDLIWASAANGENILYSRLFIALGQEYLKTHFQTHEMRSSMTVAIYEFNLNSTPELRHLRSSIFANLFTLYKKYQDQVFAALENYIRFYHQRDSIEILVADASLLVEFIKSNFSPQNISEVIFANDFLAFLEQNSVTLDQGFVDFENDISQIYNLLSEHQSDYLRYEVAEYQRIRFERFKAYFSKHSGQDLPRFIDISLDIIRTKSNTKNRHDLLQGFNLALHVLAKIDPVSFEEALSYYLKRGDELNLSPAHVLRPYMDSTGKEKTFLFLSNLDVSLKTKWLLGFYQALSENEIEEKDVSAIYQLFQVAAASELSGWIDFLLKYTSFDPRIVAKSVKIILEKSNSQYSVWALHTIINPYSDFNKHIKVLFKDDIEVLEEVYLVVSSSREHSDRASETLARILDFDLEFITRYLEQIYSSKEEKHRFIFDEQDFTALWLHQECEKIFSKVIDIVYKKEGAHHWFTNLRHFFMVDRLKQPDANVVQRQVDFLEKIIHARCQDIKFIEFLFEVIAYLPQEARSRLIFVFLQCNKSIDDFKRLEIEPGSMSWSGSAVPMYQRQIDYLKSLLPMLNDKHLLEHRSYIAQLIDRLEQNKNQEKKRDFMGIDDV